VPRLLLGIGGAALIASLVSIAVGEGGPKSAPVGGVNEVQELFGGIEQDGAFLGPDDADVTVTVFNDIQCVPCADFELNVVDPLVERYARTDQARLEFRHFSLAPNDTTLAAIASEAAGMQSRQWQYLDTFVRNQDLARGDVDEQDLRDVAEAVPELDEDRWEEDYNSPEAEQNVREDAMLADSLKLPAEPAIVVSGPGGQRTLIETPTLDDVEAAIEAVSG
jgi:protein-disulfide isomerase